jgi:hypothetical protein
VVARAPRVLLGGLIATLSLAAAACGGSEPSAAEIAEEWASLTTVLSAEVSKREARVAQAGEKTCRAQLNRAFALLNKHPERPLIVADVQDYSLHVDEIDTELGRVPRGSLAPECLEALRQLSAAEASLQEAVQVWAQDEAEFGVLFGMALADCARPKPLEEKCAYRNLDVDDGFEFTLMRMRLGAAVIRDHWIAADKKVVAAGDALARMGTAPKAARDLPRSEAEVNGSVYGKARDLMCVGDTVPADALETCQAFRDVLLQGVATDEEVDLNEAISDLLLAYQLNPS